MPQHSWLLTLGAEDASLLLPQGSSKLLVDAELKHFHSQVGVNVVGVNVFKSCSYREHWGFPLQDYFLGHFSKTTDSLTR